MDKFTNPFPLVIIYGKTLIYQAAFLSNPILLIHCMNWFLAFRCVMTNIERWRKPLIELLLYEPKKLALSYICWVTAYPALVGKVALKLLLGFSRLPIVLEYLQTFKEMPACRAFLENGQSWHGGIEAI